MLSLSISQLSNTIHQIHHTIVTWNYPDFSQEYFLREEHGARNYFFLTSRPCCATRLRTRSLSLVSRDQYDTLSTHSIASQLSLKSRNVHILRCTFHERNALPIFLTFATSEGRVKYEAFDKAECVTLWVAGSQWTLQWSDAA